MDITVYSIGNQYDNLAVDEQNEQTNLELPDEDETHLISQHLQPPFTSSTQGLTPDDDEDAKSCGDDRILSGR